MLSNNFTIMRLVFASMVVYSHSFAVVGIGEPVFLGRSLGTFAVDSFFALSGYLVTGSYWNTTPVQFIARRFMRIVPALLVFWVLSLLAWHYFEGYPKNESHTVNGPVWTIVWEVVLYCFLFFVGIAGLLSRHVVGAVYLGSIVLLTVIFDPLAVSQTVVGQLFLMFTAGSLIRLTQDHANIPLCGLLATVALAALYIPLTSEYLAALKANIPFAFGPVLPFDHLRWIVSVICLPYALIWFAQYMPLSYPMKDDYSYGVYLSAWPIQQIAAHLLGVAPLRIFAISMVGSLLAAFASWHLLERYAIRLSHQVPEHT